jgi:hypothetical protein
MSPAAQVAYNQLKEIIGDEKYTETGAREHQEQEEGGEEVLEPANLRSGLNTALCTINNDHQHQSVNNVVRLLNAHPSSESTDDRVLGHKYSIPGVPRTEFLAHQDLAIWFIMRGWLWETDMLGELEEDEMGLRKTFSSIAAAMLCKLVPEKLGLGLALSILWGNTRKEWVILALNAFPSMVSDE